MRKLIMIICVAISWVGIGHAQDAPYKASYSSNFKIADQAHANQVLTVWKDFENNTLDNHAGWFADTVSMTFANGTTVKGKAENLKGAKQYRGSLSNYKVTVDAWVSLKSDRDENVVCVWGTEEFTTADGKKVKQGLQEVWGFNKDGKIDMMLQYAQGGGAM
ncbi:MAG TPA: hypothetical protein VFE54_03995 [Mucilaginibacter sp.]|nr:hypothetical protein [Mucilaginibacter sp.]